MLSKAPNWLPPPSISHRDRRQGPQSRFAPCLSPGPSPELGEQGSSEDWELGGGSHLDGQGAREKEQEEQACGGAEP